MTEVLRPPAGRSAARVVEERPDGTVVVEADAPQDALVLLRDLFGGEPVVVSATREERGGVAGFFAKEIYRVHGGPPNPARTDPARDRRQAPGGAETAPAAAARERPDVAELLEQIGRHRSEPSGLAAALGSVDEAEETFGSVLRRELAQRGMGGAAAAPRPPAPAPAPDRPPTRVLPSTEEGSGFVDLREPPPLRPVAPDPVAPSPGVATVPPPRVESDPPAPEPVVDPIIEPAALEQRPAFEPAALEQRPALEPAALEQRPALEATPALEPPIEARPAMALGRPARSGPQGTGGVAWGVDRLSHLGVPFTLVQSAVDLDPDDDLAWIQRLAEGIRPHVMAERPGPAVFAGPRADRLAPLMDLPCVADPELPPYGGSACLRVSDHGAGRAWLMRVRGDRVLHVVIGGRNWERLTLKQPDAIAVVGSDLVLTGLQLSVEHGVPLSYLSDGSTARRATALDVALTIRELVGRR